MNFVLVCLIQPNETFLSKIQIGFAFLVPAHLGSPGKRAVINGCVCVRVRRCVRACVCVCVCV